MLLRKISVVCIVYGAHGRHLRIELAKSLLSHFTQSLWYSGFHISNHTFFLHVVSNYNRFCQQELCLISSLQSRLQIQQALRIRYLPLDTQLLFGSSSDGEWQQPISIQRCHYSLTVQSDQNAHTLTAPWHLKLWWFMSNDIQTLHNVLQSCKKVQLCTRIWILLKKLDLNVYMPAVCSVLHDVQFHLCKYFCLWKPLHESRAVPQELSLRSSLTASELSSDYFLAATTRTAYSWEDS